jgi:hypothetical protein
LIAIYRMHNLIEMRIDLVGQLIKVTPLLAKLGRFMRQAQQVPILPLNVIDDAPPIPAAVQADGHEPGLPRHESGALGHQRQTSACFSGSDSITVICVTGCLSVRMCGMDDLA